MTWSIMQNLKIPNFPEPTAVVCHDAGGANIIQAWVSQHPFHEWRLNMSGPAAKTCLQSSQMKFSFANLESLLRGSSTLLSGTSWASDVEHISRKLAKENGIQNIAVLDHWVNYELRFIRNNEEVLPDQIYVTDMYALDKAKHYFPDTPIHLYDNLYFYQQLLEIKRLSTIQNEVLYAFEPIRGDWPLQYPGEIEALKYFIDNLDKLGIPKNCLLRLRPHPSDLPNKYNKWLGLISKLHPQFILDKSLSLAESIANARWVVGCETNALVLALLSGRTAISSLPPWAPKCRLPHSEIIQLSLLA